MKRINFLIFWFFSNLFKLIPFSLMYGISDFVALLFEKVAKYRLHVINENIKRVYPSITEKEKSTLIKKIYKNLADITLEGIKGINMTDRQIKKRHIWTNPEILNNCFQNNQSVILVTGHYTNWEWGAFSPNFFLKHKIIGLYKPLTNNLINDYVLAKRASSGTVLADINLTNDFFEEYHHKKSLFLMAADQSPTKPELAIWTDFLGTNTPCLHGIEKYVNKYDLPVVYCDIQRVKRGHYTLELSWIKAPDASPMEYGAVTKRFMSKLETVIKKEPGNWLWSHRRWKHAMD